MIAPLQRGQDKDHVYTAACVEFAEEIGWQWEDVLYHWSQIALARMHSGEPQAVAEYLALANVRDALDCRGRSAN